MGLVNTKPVSEKKVQLGSKEASEMCSVKLDNDLMKQTSSSKISKKPEADDHYENLNEMEDVKACKSDEALKNKVNNTIKTEEPFRQQFRKPLDTKTKVDPFAANYDTLRMMPDVQWDKKGKI